MIKNLGYKILSITLTLIIIVIVIAYSPKAYDVILTNTTTLDFPSTAAGASSDLTMTITGAVNGDAVMLGTPNGSTLANGVFTAWISASDIATVRFTNTNLITALDPASGTFKIIIVKK